MNNSGAFDNTLIKKNFFSLIGYLKDIADFTSKFNHVFSDAALIRSAKSLVVPVPFRPFIRLMNNVLDYEITEDFAFTRNEVYDSDLVAAEKYSIIDFNFRKLNVDYLIRAADITFTELGFHTYVASVMDVEDAASSFQTKTSSGYPTFKKKGDIDAFNDAVNWVKSVSNGTSLSNILKQPTACFHRFQFKIDNRGELDRKIRQVWALPFRILTLQAVYFRRLFEHSISYVKRCGNIVTSWGLEGSPGISDVIVSRYRRLQFETGSRLISLDVSGFDHSIPTWLHALFFSGILLIYPKEFHRIIKLIMSYECFTPYCMHSGVLRFQKRGIPSGSLFTQLFGTFVSRLVINYAFLEFTNGKLSAGELANCLGDDNLVLESNISYSHLISVYRRFGLEVSVKKTKISLPGQPFDYLGPTWDEVGRPVRSEKWYVARYACPSRFYVKPEVSVSELQTYRCLALSMTLYRGLEEFERLVGYGDEVYQRLLLDVKEGRPAYIYELDPDGSLKPNPVPLKQALTHGWRYFGGKEFATDDYPEDDIE